MGDLIAGIFKDFFSKIFGVFLLVLLGIGIISFTVGKKQGRKAETDTYSMFDKDYTQAYEEGAAYYYEIWFLVADSLAYELENGSTLRYSFVTTDTYNRFERFSTTEPVTVNYLQRVFAFPGQHVRSIQRMLRRKVPEKEPIKKQPPVVG
ncbi:MAG: hypothetical protein AAF840_13925 [Bacteroidota bacterium]